jgi:hypothetical protein
VFPLLAKPFKQFDPKIDSSEPSQESAAMFARNKENQAPGSRQACIDPIDRLCIFA